MSEKQYVVHFTSMVIHAASEEEAIARAGDFKGGGEWVAEEVAGNVVPINPRPSVFMPDMNVVSLPPRMEPYDQEGDYGEGKTREEDELGAARALSVGIVLSLVVAAVIVGVGVCVYFGWIG